MKKRKANKPVNVMLSASLCLVPVAIPAQATTSELPQDQVSTLAARFGSQWQLLQSAYKKGSLRFGEDTVVPGKGDVIMQAFRNIAWGNS